MENVDYTELILNSIAVADRQRTRFLHLRRSLLEPLGKELRRNTRQAVYGIRLSNKTLLAEYPAHDFHNAWFTDARPIRALAENQPAQPVGNRPNSVIRPPAARPVVASAFHAAGLNPLEPLVNKGADPAGSAPIGNQIPADLGAPKNQSSADLAGAQPGQPAAHADSKLGDEPESESAESSPAAATNPWVRSPGRAITPPYIPKVELQLLQEFQDLHRYLLVSQSIPRTQVPKFLRALSKYPVIGITRLARDAQISQSTAKRWLRNLHEEGHLRIFEFNGMNQFAHRNLIAILDRYIRQTQLDERAAIAAATRTRPRQRTALPASHF